MAYLIRLKADLEQDMQTLEFGEQLADNQEVIRRLPQMVHYHVLVKSVVMKRQQAVETLNDLINQRINKIKYLLFRT